MLNLDGGVVGQAGKFGVHGFDDGDGMAWPVEEVGIAESDVLGPHGDLLANVGEHDVALDDAKSAIVYGDHRTMPAQIFASAAGFGGSNCLGGSVDRERRVGGQRREMGAVRRDESQPVK